MRIVRSAALALASGAAMFFMGDVLAQIISNWTAPVDLGPTINTSSAEQ